LAVGENPLLIGLSIIFTVVKLCCKNAIELSVLQSSLTITSYANLVFCNAINAAGKINGNKCWPL